MHLFAHPRRRLAAPLLALVLAAAPGAAFAEIGEAPGALLSSLGEYAPTRAGDGYAAVSGFRFELEQAEGLVIGVSGSGSLSDANMRFMGALIGAASGYGDGIAGPVADFFRTRGEELLGAGTVPIEVMEYLMYVDVREDEGGGTPTVGVRLVPQYTDPADFGPPAHALGPEGARHVVRLFTDLQCPFCAQFDAVGLPIVKERLLPRGDVRFELYHFPLKSIHPNAMVAAEASECVAAEAAEAGGFEAGEDAFWSFQSELFARQQRWAGLPDPLNEFVTAASDLGLPVEGLSTCIRSGRFGALVDESYRSAALGLRLTGTPTVFLDGLKVGDYRDVDDYERLMRLSDAIRARAQGDGQP